MYTRVHRCAVLLMLAVTPLAGCEHSVAPTPPSALKDVQPAISVEPLTVTPEFLATPACVTRPAFGVRLSMILRSQGPFVRGLRFHFLDRFGTRTLPDVRLLASPLGSPSVLPSASPVPIPGVASLPSVAPSSSVLPFFVRFGCDVIPDGTLFIAADRADNQSASNVHEMRVRIARP